MTDRELMQQALEALEIESKGYADKVTRNRAIIAALRERLAQPEQEPVAWLESEPSTKNWPLRDLFTSPMSMVYSSRWHVGSKKPDVPLGNRLTPLYTTPPRREWVGLTETEQVQVAIDCGCADVAWLDFARAIEAKLKEKNA